MSGDGLSNQRGGSTERNEHRGEPEHEGKGQGDNVPVLPAGFSLPGSRQIIEADTLPDYRLTLTSDGKARFYTRDVQQLAKRILKGKVGK